MSARPCRAASDHTAAQVQRRDVAPRCGTLPAACAARRAFHAARCGALNVGVPNDARMRCAAAIAVPNRRRAHRRGWQRARRRAREETKAPHRIAAHRHAEIRAQRCTAESRQTNKQTFGLTASPQAHRCAAGPRCRAWRGDPRRAAEDVPPSAECDGSCALIAIKYPHLIVIIRTRIGDYSYPHRGLFVPSSLVYFIDILFLVPYLNR